MMFRLNCTATYCYSEPVENTLLRHSNTVCYTSFRITVQISLKMNQPKTFTEENIYF